MILSFFAENQPTRATIYSRQPCLLFVSNSGWTVIHNSPDWHPSVCVWLKLVAVFQRGLFYCHS